MTTRISRDDVSQWPGFIEQPCLVARGGTPSLTPTGWLAWHPDPTREAQPLPAEWIFRGLQDADLDDDATLLALLDHRGMVWDRFDEFRDDDATPADLAPHRPTVPDDPSATVHISDVHGYLTALHGLADHWLAHLLGHAEPARWDWFTRALGVGLRPFTPRVAVGATLPEPVVDLYQAGCLQLFNTIADDVPVKRCHNEACGRLFLRKQGGARQGQQWRRGVLYCSDQCQWAQSKRQTRTRQAIDQ
jgi:hypothetical protein